MNLYIKNKKLICEVNTEEERFCPFTDESKGLYPKLCGLIMRHDGYDEIGIANLIDMSYKGKEDQVGDFIIKWHDGEEKFIKKIKELDLQLIEYNCTQD